MKSVADTNEVITMNRLERVCGIIGGTLVGIASALLLALPVVIAMAGH